MLWSCTVKINGSYTIPHEIMGFFAHAQTVDTRPLFLRPHGLGMRLGLEKNWREREREKSGTHVEGRTLTVRIPHSLNVALVTSS